MIKGCSKKMIFVKDTGSDFFEEAYFVLKEDADRYALPEDDIIKIATQLVDGEDLTKSKIKRHPDFPKFTSGLISGLLFGIGISILFFLLFK